MLFTGTACSIVLRQGVILEGFKIQDNEHDKDTELQIALDAVP